MDVSPLASNFFFTAISIAAILIEDLPPTSASELQSVVGYLSLLDAKVPPLDPAVSRIIQRKFSLHLLTGKVLQRLPTPSKLLKLLDEVKSLKKKQMQRGRPIGVTRAYKELLKLRKKRKEIQKKVKRNSCNTFSRNTDDEKLLVGE